MKLTIAFRKMAVRSFVGKMKSLAVNGGFNVGKSRSNSCRLQSQTGCKWIK